jgi:hypothetical protein
VEGHAATHLIRGCFFQEGIAYGAPGEVHPGGQLKLLEDLADLILQPLIPDEEAEDTLTAS